LSEPKLNGLPLLHQLLQCRQQGCFYALITLREIL